MAVIAARQPASLITETFRQKKGKKAWQQGVLVVVWKQ